MSQHYTSAFEDFAELCETLMEEGGYHFLNPVVERTRPSGWRAEIYTRARGDECREKLAGGEADTMEYACAAAVEDFHLRNKIRARKVDLLKDANVQEAMRLFGVEVKI